jgi:SAM-dependent methyltransferase
VSAGVPPGVSAGMEVHERLRRYYTAYYRDTLAIPDWATLVELRQTEERLEAQHLERVRRLVGPGAFRGRLLNVGCGTGGFNVLAAAEGARVVGVDESGEAIGISGLKARKAGGSVVQAHAEALPFPDGTFDLVYCFSAIEHVHSIGDSIREIVRVTRPGGVVYLHTNNAWAWHEGHYKVLWVPFLPRGLGRLYLRAKGRPPAYLDTLWRLTPRQLVRAFRAAGVSDLVFHDNDPPRESGSRLWPVLRWYYRLTGVSPFIEIVGRR